MIRSRVHVRGESHSRGFTLLELLLALGLSVALLVAISTSLFGYYRWRDAGERQVEHARTWLAVTQCFGDDLLQAGRGWSERRDETQLTLVKQGEQTTSVAERVLDFGVDFSLDPLVFYGDADSLTLGQMAPAASLSTSPVGKTALVQLAVNWSSKPAESCRIPYLDTGGQVMFRALGSASALANNVSLMPPKQRGNEPAIQRTVVLLDNPLHIIEQVAYPQYVQTIRFRYFDGQHWHSSWNSQQSQRLPIAVEATFSHTGDVEPLRQVFPVPCVAASNQMKVAQ